MHYTMHSTIFSLLVFRNVPQAYLSDFCCESEEATEKLQDLKERVRISGIEQYK